MTKTTNIEARKRLQTFKDAVVIVTGAASGIGAAIVEDLAFHRKARAVVLLDRQEQLCQDLMDKINNSDSQTKAKAYEVDVRDYDALEKSVKETAETYGHVDFIFNNAGTIFAGPIDGISNDDFDSIIGVNVKGVWNGIKAVYPIMKMQGYGHIVNTASIAGLFPSGAPFAAYGTTKHAIVGLSTNLRIEAARHGINVTALCPGPVGTAIWNGGAYGKSFYPKEDMDTVMAGIPIMDASVFASKALDLVGRNKPIIIVPGWPYKLLWRIFRCFPSLFFYLTIHQVKKKQGMRK